MTSGCSEFVESAEEILEKRKMNQKLLANHSTLLDLLEIPQLMDTYVLLLFLARLIMTLEIITYNTEIIVHKMLVF